MGINKELGDTSRRALGELESEVAKYVAYRNLYHDGEGKGIRKPPASSAGGKSFGMGDG